MGIYCCGAFGSGPMTVVIDLNSGARASSRLSTRFPMPMSLMYRLQWSYGLKWMPGESALAVKSTSPPAPHLLIAVDRAELARRPSHIADGGPQHRDLARSSVEGLQDLADCRLQERNNRNHWFGGRSPSSKLQSRGGIRHFSRGHAPRPSW